MFHSQTQKCPEIFNNTKNKSFSYTTNSMFSFKQQPEEFRLWFPPSLLGARICWAVSDSFYFCCLTRDSEHEEDDLAEPEFRGLWEENENGEIKVKQVHIITMRTRSYSVWGMFLYRLADCPFCGVPPTYFAIVLYPLIHYSNLGNVDIVR